jgi:hypothetical protein
MTDFNLAPDPEIRRLRAHRAVPKVSLGTVDQLKHSSPRPWIVAIATSLSVWGLIGWSIWRYTE